MARTAINPTVISTTEQTGLELTMALAANSKTWKKGEFGYISSGAINPVVNSGVAAPYCIFAEDQTTSTSTSTVPVYLLKEGTRILMYVSATGTSGTAASAVIGTKYGCYGSSNITLLDTDTTSSATLQVIRAFSTNNPEEDGWKDADAAPGLVEVEFTFAS